MDARLGAAERAQYERHDELVFGHNGTTQAEVLLFEAVAPFSVILRNAALPWLFMGRRFTTSNRYWLKFILDFSFLVVPVILSLTLLAEHIAMILLAEGIALISLIIFYLYEYCYFTCEKPPLRYVVNQVIDDQHTPTMFITYIRSMVLIATGVAILAVDFNVFPRRFAKTETYGRSVMDVGTASFTFCAALTNAFRHYPNRVTTRATIPRRFSFLYSTTMILLYLGFSRMLVLKLLDYPEHVSEYGMHWNFFITLACIRIVTKLLGRRLHLFFGIAFAVVYQFLLQENKLQEWLLSSNVKRDDFLSANREGIYSLLGYLSFYYFSSVLATFVSKTGIRLKSWIYRGLQLFLWTFILFGVQKLMESFFGPPSRRIFNVPHIFEMLVFHTFLTACFLFVQIASLFGWAAQMPQFSPDESPFELVKPCLLRAVNRHALSFFLLSNVLTGAINISSLREYCSGDYAQTALISLYTIVVCRFIFAFARRDSSC
uniref:Phosphatidylinositol-glycan biosynthesis class W protein n=1 Tax=Ascaris suum TaxID=6253 RepID=F1L181_ASCSU